MKMWICRDEDGLLHLEFDDKPPFRSIYERTVVWASNSEWGSVELDRTSFPEVTFGNSPMEVELVIKKQMKDFVIVDIDGTIAKIGDRLKYLQQEKKDWDSFYEHCDEDEPIEDIIKFVEGLERAGFKIFFCTGRRGSVSVREKTVRWIHSHVQLRHFRVLMRPDGDHRHDTEVKPEMLLKHDLTPDRVLCILEDRDSMVAKWRELGYTCLQVADGKF